MRLVYGTMFFALFTVVAFGAIGCNSDTETVGTEGKTDDQDGEEHASDEHSGWWCVEHGVPEEECALCQKALIADFKAQGDWCEDHDRPDSQCFICHPENFEKFSMRYEAKFGEKPPKPTD